MNFDRLNRWLAPLANLALLAGLALVAYELNQNRSLARMALINEGNAIQNQIWSTLMGEFPGEIIARAVECPQDMSYADFMAMDAFLFTSLNSLYRNYELTQEGIFSETDWQRSVDTYVSWFLGNPFGRAWWNEEARHFFAPEFVAYIDERLAANLGKDSHAYWISVRSHVVPSGHPAAGQMPCKNGAAQLRE